MSEDAFEQFQNDVADLSAPPAEEDFIDIMGDLDGVADAQPLTVLPAGTETRLTVKKMKVGQSAAGGRYFMAYLDTPDFPQAKDVRHLLMTFSPNATEKRLNEYRYDLRMWFELCNIVPGQYPKTPEGQAEMLRACEGAQIWAILDIEDDAQYGKQNKIKQIIGAR